MSFKLGDKVMILGLYLMTHDGPGEYQGLSKEPHFAGYFRILNEYGTIMRIEPHRVMSVDSYWINKKKEGSNE